MSSIAVISIEQMVRNLLEVSIQEGLVRPGIVKDPQNLTSGDLLIPSNLLNFYFGKEEEVQRPVKYVPKTKEAFILRLNTSAIWVERTLVALYKRQTEEEQQGSATLRHNGRGFTKADADFMSNMAKMILDPNNHAVPGRRIPLSGLKILRTRDKNGRHRLGKYYNQIMEVIREAKLAKV